MSAKSCPEIVRVAVSLDKGHGRLETREIAAVATNNTEMGFDSIQQIARLERIRENLRSGKVQQDTVYLITNLNTEQCDARELLSLKRDYWAIENKLHYRKDFVFGEDRSTMRAKHGSENMSALRNFAISLLMSNAIDNIKRCVDNIRHLEPAEFHKALFQKAS